MVPNRDDSLGTIKRARIRVSAGSGSVTFLALFPERSSPMIWRPRLSKDIGRATSSEYALYGVADSVATAGSQWLRGDPESEVGGAKKPQAGSARGRPGPSLLSDGFLKG